MVRGKWLAKKSRKKQTISECPIIYSTVSLTNLLLDSPGIYPALLPFLLLLEKLLGPQGNKLRQHSYCPGFPKKNKEACR